MHNRNIILALRGISLGIYGTSTEDGIAYVLQQSQAVVCVVDSEEQLFKVLQIWDQVPTLKAIVKYFEPPDREYKDVYTVRIVINIITVEIIQDVPQEFRALLAKNSGKRHSVDIYI